MMLARVADSLYWIGRYVERAEHMCRLSDVMLNATLDRSDAATQVARIALLAVGDTNVSKAQAPYEAALALTLERGDGGSIFSSIAHARENARQVRDQITTETWERLNIIYLRMNNPDAVKAFQINHGILPSGIVAEKTLAELNVPADTRLGMLRENLPRVEAYARDLTGEYAILVNIPAAQLETVEYGHVYSRHNIVVGKLERPSPTLASKVSDINFNPYWKIPASIVERDIVPKYMADPNYLVDNHIRIFDGVEGPEVDAALIDWTTTPPERYFFRQEPGEHNSLGSVKINFPNEFMVYMHDTPHRELFGRNVRFESSGCVRIDQVQTVVKWILDRTQAPLDEASYQNLVNSTEQFDQQIENGPDVRWMYLTAWATEDGRVNFRPDVYGLDGTDFILGQPQPKTY